MKPIITFTEPIPVIRSVEFRGLPSGTVFTSVEPDGGIVFTICGSGSRCAVCWRSGITECSKFGPYCHRCGSDEELT